MQAGPPTGTSERDSTDRSSAPAAPRKRKKNTSSQAKAKPPAGSTTETRTSRPKGTSKTSTTKAAKGGQTAPDGTANVADSSESRSATKARKSKTVRRATPSKKASPTSTEPSDSSPKAEAAPTPPDNDTSTPTSGEEPSNAAKTRKTAATEASTKPSAKTRTKSRSKASASAPAQPTTPEAKTEPAASTRSSNGSRAEARRGKATPSSTTAKTSSSSTSEGPERTQANAGSSSTITATRTTTAEVAAALPPKTKKKSSGSKSSRRSKRADEHEYLSEEDAPETLPFVEDGGRDETPEHRAEFAAQLSRVDDASDNRRVVPSSSHRVRLTSSNRRDQRPILLVVALFTQLQLTLLALVAMVTGALHAIAGVEGGLLASLDIPSRVASLTATADLGLKVLLISVAVSSFLVVALWIHQLRSPDRYEVDWLTPALPGIAVWIVSALGYLYLKLEVMGVDSEHWLLGEGVLGGLLPYIVLAIGALIGAIAASQVRDPI